MKKLFAVVLALTALSLSACAGNSESSKTEQSAVHTDESATSSTSDEISEITNTEKNEFDFDEAVKKFTIFGEPFSLPCSVNDVGGNFSLDNPDEWTKIGNVISSGIYFQGKYIGVVQMYEDNPEQITIVYLGGFIINESLFKGNEELCKAYYDKVGCYYGLIELDFGGLNFSLSADEIKNMLGEPVQTTEAYYEDYMVYEYPNGRLEIKFDGDEIKGVNIHL